MARRQRATLRLLFDECLPWKVAEALLTLGFNTSYVGREEHGQPPRRSSDEAILAHATKTGQMIVTSNHDMILLCVEQNEPVVWIDPRGRKIGHEELVVLAFTGIAGWQRDLEARTSPMCLRVLRTKTEMMSLDRAKRLVERRMRALRAKPGARSRRRQKALGQVATDDPQTAEVPQAPP